MRSLQFTVRRRHLLKRLQKKSGTKSIIDTDLIPENADLYIVALQDKAIAPLLKRLRFTPKYIAHTSGSVTLEVFPPHLKNKGVLYPLQSFSKNRKINLTTVPFLIESSNPLTKKSSFLT